MIRLVWLVIMTLVFLRFLLWSGNSSDRQKSLFFQDELILRNEPKLRNGQQFFHAGNLTVVTSTKERFLLGDRLTITGERDEQGWVWYPQIERTGQSFGLLIRILRFRQRLENQISRYLPEPQASLLKGLLLGIDDLPPKFRRDLRSSGLIHLVVASGTNVSIVAGFFLGLAGIINRRQAVLIALLAVIFYTILVGLEPPMVRAAIMAGLSFLAELGGRRSWPGWILFLTVLVMVVINPAYLYRLSFQLSFLATAGVLFLTRPIQAKLQFLPLPKIVNTATATTLAAQAAVTPRLISTFGQVSLVSPLTNALVLALVEPLMMAGAVLSLGGLIMPKEFTRFSFLLTWSPLTTIVLVTRWFASLSWASIKITGFSFWLFLPWYFFLVRWVVGERSLNPD